MDAPMEAGPAWDIPVFAICRASAIAPGAAKSFSLSRRMPDGEVRPFSIFVVRRGARDFFGYENICPHNRIWLNIASGDFFNAQGTRLACGRHKAEFDIETGACVSGPCAGAHLTPLALTVIGGDVCLCGVELAEADTMPDPFSDPDPDDTMEIMIHPG